MSERDPLLPVSNMMRSTREIDAEEQRPIIDYGRSDVALDVLRDNKKRIMYAVVGLGVAAAVVTCLVLGIMWAVDESSGDNDNHHPVPNNGLHPPPPPSFIFIYI
jgi:hypothetical protein